jgi:hypothetical protein
MRRRFAPPTSASVEAGVPDKWHAFREGNQPLLPEKNTAAILDRWVAQARKFLIHERSQGNGGCLTQLPQLRLPGVAPTNATHAERTDFIVYASSRGQPRSSVGFGIWNASLEKYWKR